MAIKLSQSLKQTQNLMMTPQLQQAIKLLTLTHLEMTNVIAEEMVENPLLEELDGGQTAENKSEDEYRSENIEQQNQEAVTENFDERPMVSQDDFDWNNYIDASESNTYVPVHQKTDLDDVPNYENIISKGETLAEHLEWQLRMESLTKAELDLAEEIIHNINDDGYLEYSFEEIIAKSTLKRDHAFEILNIIQRLDPVGCGSANLTECLLVQAKIMEERSPLLETLIKNHLSDLQNKDYKKIAKTTGASIDAIKDTAMLLHNFHPRPGRLVAAEDTLYVVPDIYVHEVGGVFVVKVNDEGVPRLKISGLYKSMLKASGSGNGEAQEYVKDKLRSAMWLIKSIQNRQRTIVKVSEAIVRQQQDFFKKGPEFLKPMILKNIANEIGMHESTVSRVTTNKYMHTPIGLFELKYFFNTGVGGGKNGGVDVSSEVLRSKIKSFIENENPKRPLSDQKIAEILSKDDVQIARRTVTKYREMMGIESSAKRKAT